MHKVLEHINKNCINLPRGLFWWICMHIKISLYGSSYPHTATIINWYKLPTVEPLYKDTPEMRTSPLNQDTLSSPKGVQNREVSLYTVHVGLYMRKAYIVCAGFHGTCKCILYFLKISLHLEIMLPSKFCHIVFLLTHPHKCHPWILTAW